MINRYKAADLIQIGDEFCLIIDINRKPTYLEIEVLHCGISVIVIDDGRRSDIKLIKGIKKC